MTTAGVSEYNLLYRRILSGPNPLLAQVFFDVAVLERYRDRPGFSIVRTDTIGRVQRNRSWSIDFGVSPQDGVIHVSVGDLIHKLPEAERDHWTAHAVGLPLSENLVKAQLTPASCIDDGELRPW